VSILLAVSVASTGVVPVSVRRAFSGQTRQGRDAVRLVVAHLVEVPLAFARNPAGPVDLADHADKRTVKMGEPNRNSSTFKLCNLGMCLSHLPHLR
jgi:hypothetical protein